MRARQGSAVRQALTEIAFGCFDGGACQRMCCACNAFSISCRHEPVATMHRHSEGRALNRSCAAYFSISVQLFSVTHCYPEYLQGSSGHGKRIAGRTQTHRRFENDNAVDRFRSYRNGDANAVSCRSMRSADAVPAHRHLRTARTEVERDQRVDRTQTRDQQPIDFTRLVA